MKRFFTSESVTEGHPDKLCDLISDSLLDAYLAKDKNSRVAIETVASKGVIFITGEVTSNANYSNEEIEKIVRDVVKEIGYFGDVDIDYKTCKIEIHISKQSQDIAQGVDKSLEDKEGENVSSEGAGDQGMMFGFACDETEELMPLGISLAHKLARRLTEVRKNNIIKGIGADGKTQVTVEYDDDKVKRIDTVIVSVQHKDDKDVDVLRKEIEKEVIREIIPNNLIDEKTKILINPTGRFVIGGPLGDSGLTGRKIIVDTYGGYARHGGGAFSGKDATKVDRSACYAARYLAKNIVAAGVADKCEIQLSYAIGIDKPVSIYINTFGTNKVSEESIIECIKKNFPLTPKWIIEHLDLRRPIYRATAAYGHFGRDEVEFTWENLDIVDIFKKLL